MGTTLSIGGLAASLALLTGCSSPVSSSPLKMPPHSSKCLLGVKPPTTQGRTTAHVATKQERVGRKVKLLGAGSKQCHELGDSLDTIAQAGRPFTVTKWRTTSKEESLMALQDGRVRESRSTGTVRCLSARRGPTQAALDPSKLLWVEVCTGPCDPTAEPRQGVTSRDEIEGLSLRAGHQQSLSVSTVVDTWQRASSDQSRDTCVQDCESIHS